MQKAKQTLDFFNKQGSQNILRALFVEKVKRLLGFLHKEVQKQSNY